MLSAAWLCTALMATQNVPSPSMVSMIVRFSEDRGSLERAYPISISAKRTTRLTKLFQESLTELKRVNFDGLDSEGKVDYLLFKNYLNHEVREIEIDNQQMTNVFPLIPFSGTIMELEESRRRFEKIDPAALAVTLTELEKTIRTHHKEIETGLTGKTPLKVEKTRANRVVQVIERLKGHFKDWVEFYEGYDPMFSWWCSEPQKGVTDALSDYQTFVREKLVGIKPDDKTTIIGFPIGAEALQAELDYEMIRYTPDELVEIANKEFAWCEAEMKKASSEMGFGDDWKRALEKVKMDHVEPGKQPELIKELALEAIKFVEDKNLVTVPHLAKETWRMSMMSPDRQLQSPFFLGGEQILVSYPTAGMSQEAKLMSMRGNNKHFARATVQHELIPGHHLQQFMTSRNNTHRGLFNTPFWVEGWALYWEFLLYDIGFPKSPENRVGMLFWRMHRCARIIFSLGFHLGKMTPQECVDFLVDRVGHERDNASAEVRRSFAGNYGPLYQAAYMLGGLQIRAMRHELVDPKKMTDKQFHDAILIGNTMPIEMVRARVSGAKLTKDWKSSWRFYEK